MKTIIGAVCASLALMALTPAQAWANPQHERMRRCNAEAKEQTLKGEERKAFMSTCLRGRHEAGAAPAAAGTAPAAAPAAAGVDGPGEVVKAPVAAAVTAAAAPAAMAAPAAAVPAPTTAAPTTAAPTTVAPTTVAAAETASAEDKARAKACNRSASEQSLRGAKRKAFVAECLKG